MLSGKLKMCYLKKKEKKQRGGMRTECAGKNRGRQDVRAIDDPVGVEHRDDLEDEGLPQALGHGVAAAQELQAALHNPAGIALPGVHACRQHHTGPITCTGRSRGKSQREGRKRATEMEAGKEKECERRREREREEEEREREGRENE